MKNCRGLCNFLWGSTMAKRKFHLLSWERVRLPMIWGGLGIKRLKDLNMALLCKWLWNLGNGEDRLWKKIICEKYGRDVGGWLTRSNSKPYGCGLWRGSMLSLPFFQSKIHFRVGNGMRIKFWEDHGVQKNPSKISSQRCIRSLKENLT